MCVRAVSVVLCCVVLGIGACVVMFLLRNVDNNESLPLFPVSVQHNRKERIKERSEDKRVERREERKEREPVTSIVIRYTITHHHIEKLENRHVTIIPRQAPPPGGNTTEAWRTQYMWCYFSRQSIRGLIVRRIKSFP